MTVEIIIILRYIACVGIGIYRKLSHLCDTKRLNRVTK